MPINSRFLDTLDRFKLTSKKIRDSVKETNNPSLAYWYVSNNSIHDSHRNIINLEEDTIERLEKTILKSPSLAIMHRNRFYKKGWKELENLLFDLSKPAEGPYKNPAYRFMNEYFASIHILERSPIIEDYIIKCATLCWAIGKPSNLLDSIISKYILHVYKKRWVEIEFYLYDIPRDKFNMNILKSYFNQYIAIDKYVYIDWFDIRKYEDNIEYIRKIWKSQVECGRLHRPVIDFIYRDYTIVDLTGILYEKDIKDNPPYYTISTEELLNYNRIVLDNRRDTYTLKDIFDSIKGFSNINHSRMDWLIESIYQDGRYKFTADFSMDCISYVTTPAFLTPRQQP